jgi:hypothetical protein
MIALRETILVILRGEGAPPEKRQRIKGVLAPLFDQCRDGKCGQNLPRWCDDSRGSATIPRNPTGGLDPDEVRIRSARKSLKFGHGNCSWKSAIVATWLLENSVNVPIYTMNCDPFGHAYVLLGAADFSLHFAYQPDDVWVVDGWSDDFYPANNGLSYVGDDPPPYGSPGGLQYNVRSLLLGEQLLASNITEIVHLNTPPHLRARVLPRPRPREEPQGVPGQLSRGRDRHRRGASSDDDVGPLRGYPERGPGSKLFG